jgi:hypothetical protein
MILVLCSPVNFEDAGDLGGEVQRRVRSRAPAEGSNAGRGEGNGVPPNPSLNPTGKKKSEETVMTPQQHLGTTAAGSARLKPPARGPRIASANGSDVVPKLQTEAEKVAARLVVLRAELGQTSEPAAVASFVAKIKSMERLEARLAAQKAKKLAAKAAAEKEAAESAALAKMGAGGEGGFSGGGAADGHPAKHVDQFATMLAKLDAASAAGEISHTSAPRSLVLHKLARDCSPATATLCSAQVCVHL